MYSIGLNKYFTSLPKIHDCLSPPNLGLDQWVTQGVLDNCRRLASGYRLRKVIVLFPTMDRFFNQRSKATLLNRRRTLGRTFRQMDTLSHIHAYRNRGTFLSTSKREGTSLSSW